MKKKSPEHERTYHVLLRYSEKVAPQPGTIELHKKVLKNHGHVWLGKVGKPVGSFFLEKLQSQTKAKQPTYIFLVNWLSRGEYAVHAGLVHDFKRRESEVDYYPTYYKRFYGSISTWFKISKIIKLDSKILKKLQGKSSMLPINLSLRSSMASAMFVSLDKKYSLKEFIAS